MLDAAGRYKDLYLNKVELSTQEEIRDAASLHIMNHIIKSVIS